MQPNDAIVFFYILYFLRYQVDLEIFYRHRIREHTLYKSINLFIPKNQIF